MDVVTAPSAQDTANTSQGKGGKYLTFKLGREEYGLSLIRVREIIALMDITAVPLAPSYVRGVMNLRGRVIPVVDLRKKFGMDPTDDHDRKCIIVVDVMGGDTSIQMSVLVDAVSEVLHIASEEIEDAPPFRSGVHTTFIHGIAKAKTGVKILLDVDIILSNISPPNTTGPQNGAAPTA